MACDGNALDLRMLALGLHTSGLDPHWRVALGWLLLACDDRGVWSGRMAAICEGTCIKRTKLYGVLGEVQSAGLCEREKVEGGVEIRLNVPALASAAGVREPDDGGGIVREPDDGCPRAGRWVSASRTMGVREPDDLVRARASSDLPSYPTDTQAAAPLPPTGGAAAAGLADEGKGNPDPSEQGERIGAVVSDLDSDEHAGKAEAAQRLMRALAHRGARLDRKAMGAVQSMLASRPTALIVQLGMMVERGSSPVHSPIGLLRSLLPEAVDAVEAEAKARAELRAAYAPRPDGKGWETPEQKARREAIENMAAPEVANAAFAKMLEMME